MHSANMKFKINTLLTVYILLCIQIVYINSATVSYYNRNNDLCKDNGIIKMFRIKDMSVFKNSNGFKDTNFLSLFKGRYLIEMHSDTKNTGLIIQNKSNDLFDANKNFYNGRFRSNSEIEIHDYSSYWNTKSVDLYGNECSKYNFNQEILDTMNKFDTCFGVIQLKYRYIYLNYRYSYNQMTIFELNWKPENLQTCLSITYIHKKYLSLPTNHIILSINNKYKEEIFSTTLENGNNVKTLIIKDIYLEENERYTLLIQLHFESQYYNDNNNKFDEFGLLHITQSSNFDDEIPILIKSNIQKMYENPELYYINDNENVTTKNVCFNGGYYLQSSCPSCVCPPGFTGQFCEKGCGPNLYGANCEAVCSMNTNKMCRGILMCTHYGCTCPPGLTGPWCNDDCPLGKYGANCKQICSSNCYNTCDQYTGICSQGCSPGYKPPYCLKKYPYLKTPPQLISTGYEELELEINFQSDNLKDDDKNITLEYYQLLYKSMEENTFNYSEVKLIDGNITTITEFLYNLEPYTNYTVGVLVITDEWNYNEENIVFGQYGTTCSLRQVKDYNVKLTSGTKSINITWDKIVTNRLECNITSYVLTLMLNQSQTQLFDTQEIIAHSDDSSQYIDNLLPGFQYNIKLTPITVIGPMTSSPIYTISIPMTENDVQIKDITIETKPTSINVSWKFVNSYLKYVPLKEPIAVTCVIKYKIIRLLSCSTRELNDDWSEIQISNLTSYEIFGLIPNSQYIINVVVAREDTNSTTQQENAVKIITPASTPVTEPIFDDQPIYVTNSSVLIQWKMDPENCTKLNGYFSKYYIQLKNKKDNTIQIKETKNNYILFDNLISSNFYEIKVFIKTHFGHNPEKFLIYSFKTKSENLKAVDDLMVYKKSLKNRMVGLRWSYAENTELNGFIFSFNEDAIINTKNISVIPPTKCSAWPEYYCYTFSNLNPSNNYTFKIKPKSLDYPEGGKLSSISFNSRDGLPDPPTNIKTIEIRNTSIIVQWDIPWIFNGELKMFIINVEEISAIDMNTCCAGTTQTEFPFENELPSFNYTLTDLKPGSTYSVGVISVSKSSWYSSPARILATTVIEY